MAMDGNPFGIGLASPFIAAAAAECYMGGISPNACLHHH